MNSGGLTWDVHEAGRILDEIYNILDSGYDLECFTDVELAIYERLNGHKYGKELHDKARKNAEKLGRCF